MISGVESPVLSSNAAWDWTDSAPWSVRTQTDEIRLNQQSFSTATADDWIKISSGTYTPETYDTNDYKSPVNMRVSAVVGGTWNTYEAEKLDLRLRIRSSGGSNYLYTDWTTNAVLNIPIPVTSAYTYDLYVRRPNFQENFGCYGEIMFTYDIYYRDDVVTQPTQAPFTLPSDWTNDTTEAITYNTDVIPTYTTAVDIEDVTISDYDISENTSFMSAILSTLQGFSYTYNLIAGSLPYWWAIVIGLALAALIAWLLH